MRFRPHLHLILVMAGALGGLLFASVSTYDFVQHLDRQVHDVHCSFVPGLSGPEAGGSGCQVTLMSPYSSVMRETVWGGVPISLPAMAVFAFLLFLAVELTLTERHRDRRAAGLLALATAVPALTSVIMGYLSVVELGAACKLCIAIYVASAVCFAGGLGTWLRSRRSSGTLPPPRRAARPAPAKPDDEHERNDPAWVGAADTIAAAPAAERARPPSEPPPHHGAPAADLRYLAAAVGVGLAFVLIPVAGYVAAAPEHERFIGQCGALEKPGDEYGVMVPLGEVTGAPPVLEVLDPLCPACRGFEERLRASGLIEQMDRKVLLFPLDDECNWMVDEAVHPGACAISEAVLCAGDRAEAVIDWAFANQDAIMTAARTDREAARVMARQQFPELASCVGAAEVRARLNRSLRWVVANSLPVLTPQIYVGNVKLCDEDVDLGLDYTLSRMLAAHRAGTLRAADEPAGEPAPAEPGTRPARDEAAPQDETAPAAGGPDAQPPATGTPPPGDGTGADENEAPAAPATTDDAPGADDPMPAEEPSTGPSAAPAAGASGDEPAVEPPPPNDEPTGEPPADEPPAEDPADQGETP